MPAEFTPTARVIADSVYQGHRLTTMEVALHRYMLAEFNTHRAFCLAGDTILEFDLPAGSPHSKHRAYRMRLDEFVEKWHEGARRAGANPKRDCDLSWVDPRREYTGREVAGKLGMATPSNIHRLCREGLLPARKDNGIWLISGQAVLDWRTSAPEHTRFDIRDRLRAMAIRQMDVSSKQIVTACVVDATYSGVKEVFNVSLANGMHVAGSADHRILTAQGWKTIGQLTTDDLVYVRRRGTPEDERRDAKRLTKINGRWRSVWQRQMAKKFRADDPMCRICRLQPGVDVHHWTPVHIEPSLAFDEANVTFLCNLCHVEKHQVQGWQGGTYLYGALSAVVSVVSRGVEPTYDLTIGGPFANFLANGVVVHNSRNSASSRAIPVHRTLDRLAATAAYPLEWTAEQPGMQGGAQVGDRLQREAREIWDYALRMAIISAKALTGLGIHKSVTNRLLEPFMPTTVIVSATEWANFFDQRCSPLAQPEMRAAAEAMRDAYTASTPTPVRVGHWHLPYISGEELHTHGVVVCRKVAAARCARVSYLTHDGRRDIAADLHLFARLTQADPPHFSPLEHVATPAINPQLYPSNFTGWWQLRHIEADQ